jgi:hypothetical protein
LVGEAGDAALEGQQDVEEAHGFLVAGLAEQALAGPGGDWEDLRPQLVGQVVLDQRAYELKAVGDDGCPRLLARVADTTYSGRLFSLSASSPLRDGHRAASRS